MAFQQWTMALLGIDLPAFLFNISMIVFLLVQIRKNNPEFNSGFYKLFIVVAINDSLYYIETSFLSRFALAGNFLEFYLGNSIAIQIWDNVGYTLNGYLATFNLLGHTTIAFNRFSSLFLSQRYQWLWSGRRLKMIIVLLFLLSLLCVSYRIYGPFHYILTPNGIIGLYDSPIINEIFPIERTISTVSTSIITLILEAATGIKYRLIWHKLNHYNKDRYKRDMQLFIHSILIFIVQCALTSYFVIYWICLWYNYTALLHGVQQSLVILSDLISLGAPIFLFCVSTVLRSSYLDFYGIKVVWNNFTRLFNRSSTRSVETIPTTSNFRTG